MWDARDFLQQIFSNEFLGFCRNFFELFVATFLVFCRKFYGVLSQLFYCILPYFLSEFFATFFSEFTLFFLPISHLPPNNLPLPFFPKQSNDFPAFFPRDKIFKIYDFFPSNIYWLSSSRRFYWCSSSKNLWIFGISGKIDQNWSTKMKIIFTWGDQVDFLMRN